MERYIKVLLICVCLCVLLGGCADGYRDENFLWKTSLEIEEEYGEFDCVTMPASGDGLYRNCRCGYTVKEAKQGLLSRAEERLFFITFDEEGIAVECEEGYRPGG